MPYGHGKVILLGEHSVVHGRPALALAVERGAHASWSAAAPGSPTSLHIEPWRVDIDTGVAPNLGLERLQEALRAVRALYSDDVELALQVQMRVPGGAGMGSSAALGVAVLRALDEARGSARPDAEINERSMSWERVFHGTPSGIDGAMATYGGLQVFSKGKPLQRVVPRHKLRLLVANSGSAHDAREMVQSVARQREREPQRLDKLFDAIAAIVWNGKLALEQGELKALGQLMTMNHKLLSALMLSTDTLEEMIEVAMGAGALGAKLTGAGGGGCMIALVDNDQQHAAVKAALTGLGKSVYEVESGV